MNPDSSYALLQKLCELQQAQLEKTAELSKHLADIAADARKNSDRYQVEADAYEQSLREYRESDLRHEKRALRGGIMIASMLGLIAAAIIVARFL
jgi:hypothetical protein